ncbi:hypothetical protein [Winogradskyella ludwigii]|jgi:hypothetical protein|uniref:hypothetical protein n=1 Tax=Winogradskyella ludwigii TaxID=2686076 RepID=UPI0015CB4B39|nr:hypothetical protein [Winogradskyella ludwigii]
MTTVFIYGLSLIGHLGFYFYFINNFKRDEKPLERRTVSSRKVENKDNLISKSLKNNAVDDKVFLLNKNLKQLELISEFEMYLEQKTPKKASLEFLEQFKTIKTEAQLSALKTTNKLNS